LKIIEQNSGLWRELQDWLCEKSYGKCWYTEARDSISYWHVDHYRPKAKIKDLNNVEYDGYWWLAFNWKNYRLAGSATNIYF